MNQNQLNYINNYNKANYKMYQIRVKRNSDLIDYLDNKVNRNSYIVELIEKDRDKDVPTLKAIRKIIVPILNKYGITDINLFGSYARGEATKDSDVDIYCDPGNIRNLIEQGQMEEELENALNKEVDVIFNTSELDDFFREQIMEDMIKLC